MSEPLIDDLAKLFMNFVDSEPVRKYNESLEKEQSKDPKPKEAPKVNTIFRKTTLDSLHKWSKDKNRIHLVAFVIKAGSDWFEYCESSGCTVLDGVYDLLPLLESFYSMYASIIAPIVLDIIKNYMPYISQYIQTLLSYKGQGCPCGFTSVNPTKSSDKPFNPFTPSESSKTPFGQPEFQKARTSYVGDASDDEKDEEVFSSIFKRRSDKFKAKEMAELRDATLKAENQLREIKRKNRIKKRPRPSSTSYSSKQAHKVYNDLVDEVLDSTLDEYFADMTAKELKGEREIKDKRDKLNASTGPSPSSPPDSANKNDPKVHVIDFEELLGHLFPDKKDQTKDKPDTDRAEELVAPFKDNKIDGKILEFLKAVSQSSSK